MRSSNPVAEEQARLSELSAISPSRHTSPESFEISYGVQPGLAGDPCVSNPCVSNPCIVMRSPSELRPHPSWIKHQVGLSPARVSAIAAPWDPSKLDPISITRNGTILEGHEICELARKRELCQVPCLEHDMNEEQALLWIIQHSTKHQPLNAYIRAVLALDYEPFFRERARENQRRGGKLKGSTTLPEDQPMDCRKEIAALARISEGTISKVRRLRQDGCPELHNALRDGVVSIHWASLLSQDHEEQRKRLQLHVAKRGIRADIAQLQRRHRLRPSLNEGQLDVQRIGNALAAMKAEKQAPIIVDTISTPGRIALFSEDLLHALETQGQLLP